MKVQSAAPRFDDATQFSFKWYGRTIEKARGKIDLLEHLEDEAKRDIFLQGNKTFLPDIILFYDHGTEDGLVAQGGQGYVIDTQNIDQIKGEIFYVMACSSAERLGRKAWTLDWVYFGYTDVVGFTVEDEELFCEATGHGFLLLVDGETDYGKIKQAVIDKFNEFLDLPDLDPWTRFWLRHDRDCWVAYNGEEPPPSTCTLRNLAIKMFGPKTGWKIPNPLYRCKPPEDLSA